MLYTHTNTNTNSIQMFDTSYFGIDIDLTPSTTRNILKCYRCCRTNESFCVILSDNWGSEIISPICQSTFHWAPKLELISVSFDTNATLKSSFNSFVLRFRSVGEVL